MTGVQTCALPIYLQSGLHVISNRCEALNRFTGAYARLARLPAPRPQPVGVAQAVARVVRLEQRLAVSLLPGPELTVNADPDQLDHLLINLLRNAVDASLETGGAVSLTWGRSSAGVEVSIADEGFGIANPANLFVPFFTTKPGGLGVGLFLCRQIAEAHGGSVTLRNRTDRRGCEALVTLPVR